MHSVRPAVENSVPGRAGFFSANPQASGRTGWSLLDQLCSLKFSGFLHALELGKAGQRPC